MGGPFLLRFDHVAAKEPMELFSSLMKVFVFIGNLNSSDVSGERSIEESFDGAFYRSSGGDCRVSMELGGEQKDSYNRQ